MLLSVALPGWTYARMNTGGSEHERFYGVGLFALFVGGVTTPFIGLPLPMILLGLVIHRA